jgi:hypothetical protein
MRFAGIARPPPDGHVMTKAAQSSGPHCLVPEAAELARRICRHVPVAPCDAERTAVALRRIRRWRHEIAAARRW